MEIKLSCPCCGHTEFIGLYKLQYSKVLVDEIYLHKENEMKEQVYCGRCKLEDYVGNLSLKVILKDKGGKNDNL